MAALNEFICYAWRSLNWRSCQYEVHTDSDTDTQAQAQAQDTDTQIQIQRSEASQRRLNSWPRLNEIHYYETHCRGPKVNTLIAESVGPNPPGKGRHKTQQEQDITILRTANDVRRGERLEGQAA